MNKAIAGLSCYKQITSQNIIVPTDIKRDVVIKLTSIWDQRGVTIAAYKGKFARLSEQIYVSR